MTGKWMVCGILLLGPLELAANQSAHGFCEQGAQAVVTSGQQSSTRVQGSFPSCTVTVYLTGTTTLATLYSDNASTPTPKGNPFTANTFGYWNFYAANGRYDVRLSGGGLPAPWTIGDVLLADPSGGPPVNDWGPRPPGLQTQYLEIKPNTGNNTTLDWMSLPYINAASYNFPPQSPGGNLGTGPNPITLTPCPLGLNGSNQNYYLYLSGGVGAAEAVLVIGGTCTSGAPTGTVIITAANTHSGAWTVRSSTAGIEEALQAASSQGVGNVLVPAGTYAVYSAVHVPTNTTLMGAGEGITVIRIADGQLSASLKWAISPTQSTVYCVVCLNMNGTNQRVHDLTIDSNGTAQTWIYYGELTTHSSSNVIISSVTVRNHVVTGGTGIAFVVYGGSNNVIVNSKFIGLPNCIVPNGGGAFYLTGLGNRVISSYSTNNCDSPYVLAECTECGVYDSVFDLGSGQITTPVFSIEGAINSTFSGNRAYGSGPNVMNPCFGVASQTNMTTTGTVLINNSCEHAETAVLIAYAFSGTSIPVHNTNITNMIVSNATNGILIGGLVRGIDINGGVLSNLAGSGIWVSSNGVSVAQNVFIRGVKIDHNSGPGGGILIESDAAPGTSPINGLTIVDSFIGDSAAVPVQTFGIEIHPGPVSNVVIKDNTMTGNVNRAMQLQCTFTNTVIGPNATSGNDSLVRASTISAPVASTNVITPSGSIFHVTGTATIAGINALTGYPGSTITIIPDGAFNTVTGGNIAIGSTAVVGKALVMTWDPARQLWYPSY